MAQRQFKGYTPERMKMQYGQSGETCQQILDGYQRLCDAATEAIREVESL